MLNGGVWFAVGGVFFSMVLCREPHKLDPTRVTTDTVVMDTVMVDLMTAKELQGPAEPQYVLDQPQVFHTSTPGYSQDRKFACVYLTYPWSGGFHGGVATYVLAKRKEKWIVLVRQYIRYV